jgi:hypothetical protein
MARLVVNEPESPELVHFLAERNTAIRAYSSIGRQEVLTEAEHEGTKAVRAAHRLLDNPVQLEVHASGPILTRAQDLLEQWYGLLWSEAVHLSTAIMLRPAITTLISYNGTLLAAAAASGIDTAAPGQFR